jgi:hypothetical protein
MYVEHIALVKAFGRRYVNRYRHMRAEDVFSCIDFAFIKACRAWDPARGRFSTIFARLIEGECSHWRRDHGYGIRSTDACQHLGNLARRLMGEGLTLRQARDQMRGELLAAGLSARGSRDSEVGILARTVIAARDRLKASLPVWGERPAVEAAIDEVEDQLVAAVLRESLRATEGLAHDVLGFDLHADSRPTPWEVLTD